MPLAREAFGTLGDVVALDGRAISRADVSDADMLAIRSTTEVGPALLDGSSVGFVGTATIGTDHLDTAYLEERGIRWCYSPGCNANSVSEYIASALLCLACRHNFSLEGKTIGVIGVGNVGRLVVQKAMALGMHVLPNDPPRERAEGPEPERGLRFATLDHILADADVVTLHVPLTSEGIDATRLMAGRDFFRRMKPGAIFINAARGGVADADALMWAMDEGLVSRAVIDTWEGEPGFRADLLARVDVGTPHIAGHSFEGKVAGTAMVYREACDFLGAPPDWTPDALLPEPPVPRVESDVFGEDERDLWDLVRQVYDIRQDDSRLRAFDGDETERAAYFDGLRKSYPIRREFRFTQVALRNAADPLLEKVRGLGFMA